jgi:predicted RNase H-like HicB family nuclease
MRIPIKTITFNLPVSFLKESDQFVAYTPALDLSTSGDTLEEAQKNFTEAVGIFFEEITSMGTLEDVLLDLGWKKQDDDFIPPVIVSQGVESVKVPFAHA